MKTKYIWIITVFFGLLACENDNDSSSTVEVILPELDAGEADFSNFISLGASFTAGFSDGGLFIESQKNSFPNTISKQFMKIEGSDFSQPLMNDNFGGLTLGGTRILEPRLVFGGAGPVPLESIIGPITIGTELTMSPSGPFNNFGVPGAKSFHLLASGYGNIANLAAGLANPYAIRLTGTTPNASILDIAIAQNPTFFTLSEIGGNDVLGYAISGGDGSDPITDATTFNASLDAIVNGLTANGAKGAIGNLPNITSLPFFTTVPHNPIPLDAASAGFLNSPSAYGAYNAGLIQAFDFLVANTPMTQEMANAEIEKRTITFTEGEGNAVVIMDENLTDLTAINAALVSMRQATSNDLFVLPASSFIGTEAIPGNPQTVNGVAIPLEDKWVLTPEEQQEITDATLIFNNSIQSIATSKGLALVDLNRILEQATTTGITFDEFNMNTNLVFGGLVSLDGIHLTPRGYALMANSFLESIDATYGSNFFASGNVAKAAEFTVNFSPTL